jgi:hypothetical protein
MLIDLFLSKRGRGETQGNSKVVEKTCRKLVAMIRLLKPSSVTLLLFGADLKPVWR